MSDTRPRLEKILDLYGQALAEAVGQREPESQEAKLPAKDLLLRFAGADPTDGKARTQWLVKTYIKDEQFKLEDLGRADAALAAFERFKRRLPMAQRELSRFKKLRDLEALVDPFVKSEERARLTRDLSSATGREKRRLECVKARDESIVLQEGKGLPTIAVPMTEFASKWWGRGTQWCTAADKDNAFMMYHKDAPLVIIVCPDGSKFQAHVGKDDFQFMDITDEDVSEEIIQERWNEFQSLVYWAIEQNGRVLQFVPENKKTPELCRMAVQQNGSTLFHVPEDQKTTELYRIAIEQNGQTLQYVSDEHRTTELCQLAVEQDGRALQYVPAKYKTEELCRLAVQQNGVALIDVPEKYRTLELYYLAVQQDGYTLKYVPKEYKAELCRTAVEQNGCALGYVPENQRTSELCCIAVQKYGNALFHVPSKYQTPELYRLAVEQDGCALGYVPSKYKTPELCRLAIEKDGTALQYLPLDLIASRYEDHYTLCRLAVQQNKDALQYVPEEYITPELMALIPPVKPQWHPDILQGLYSQSSHESAYTVSL
jgi:Domain of unknown function (DUF4116)